MFSRRRNTKSGYMITGVRGDPSSKNEGGTYVSEELGTVADELPCLFGGLKPRFAVIPTGGDYEAGCPELVDKVDLL